MSNRISREELVKIYNVEISFFDSLQESGLLQTETVDQITYLMYDDLPVFEKFATWHYDLEVNLPGLEVIHHLLIKLDELSKENRRLAQKSGNLRSF